MLCEQGEGDDNDRLRFLLLAGDTLVEIAADSPYGTRRLGVRHFVRVRSR